MIRGTHSQGGRRVPLPAGLLLLAAIAVPAGCASTGPAEPDDQSVLTGYEFGNPDDVAETRKDRPDYRPFE